MDKTVPYSVYAKVLKENEELKQQISSMEAEEENAKAEEETTKTVRKKAGQ